MTFANTPRPVRLRIDRLVLDGVPPHRAAAVARSLGQAIARRLAEAPLPDGRTYLASAVVPADPTAAAHTISQSLKTGSHRS